MSKPSYKKNDTAGLVILAQSGDIKAVEKLIRQEQKHIYALFSHLVDKKEDISDLTQEVLLKMAKNIKKLQNPESFRAWLNRIVTNTFNDYIKKKPDITVTVSESKLNEIKDKLSCEPGDRCFFSEVENLIKSALQTLPQTLRIALVLREYEGLSYEDISRLTNTTLGTVKSRIARARTKLRDELKEFI